MGAYHPFSSSNTAFFWLKGWNGFNIDANEKSIAVFNKIRKKDNNICCASIPQTEWDKGIRFVSLNFVEGIDSKEGISASAKVIDVSDDSTIKVHAKTINQLLDEFHICHIDYMNIDIEGIDEHILAEFPFKKILPAVISVEDYSDEISTLISSKITLLLNSQGYKLIGRVGLTSIFRHKEYIG